MSLKTRSFYTGLLLALFLCLSINSVYAANKVVARVGSVPITEFELNQKLQKLIPLASSFHSGVAKEKVDELRDEALQDLIESAYMVHYAIDEGISVSKADVDQEFNRIKDSFADGKAFEKALGSLTVAELRAAIYRKLLAARALDVAVNNKVDVSTEDLKKYYQANKEKFKRPRQFRASHILLKVDPSAPREEWEKRLEFAHELIAKARSGEDFYNLAYYNSDDRTKFVGGDMGFFHQGQVMKEIEDAILDMDVGDISEPVKTIYGYSIIKLVEDNPPTQLSFDEMKVKLREMEEKEQYESMKKNWLDDLKSRYKVEHVGS